MKVIFPITWKETFGAELNRLHTFLPPHLPLEVIVYVDREKLTASLKQRIEVLCTGYPHDSVSTRKQVHLNLHITSDKLWKSISKVMGPEDVVIWPFRLFQPLAERFFDEPDLSPILDHIKGRILIMPKNPHPIKIDHLAMATNFKPGINKAIDKIWSSHVQLTSHKDKNQIKRTIFSVTDENSKPDALHKAELEHRYKTYGDVAINVNPSVYNGILEFVKKSNVDVLGIYLPHRNVIGKLRHFHLTRDLIHKTEIPVLLFCD